MFAKKPSASAAGNPPPQRIQIGAVQHYMTAFEAPRASNKRLRLALAGVTAIALVLALSVKAMLPLHERVPYFVTVNHATGAVAASNSVAQRFTPTDATKRYFLAKWVTDLLQVDDQTKAERLPASYAVLRGSALGEWRQFIFNKWKPLDRLKDNSAARIYPTVDSVALLGDDSAVMRVSTHDEKGVFGKPAIVTVKYAILAPDSDAEVLRNPIGLWITHFEVSHEAQ